MNADGIGQQSPGMYVLAHTNGVERVSDVPWSDNFNASADYAR
jgi:hypothetical protein